MASLAFGDYTNPSECDSYEDPLYWERLYQEDPEPYEWLQTYAEVREFVENATARDLSARILHAGCGNSLLPEQMYDEGYKHIVNIDTSPTVIKLMRERSAKRAGMQWEVMDAAEMRFPSEDFDVVLDKSLFDVFDCAEEGPTMQAEYLQEVFRVLRPGGAFFCLTLSEPEYILPRILQATGDQEAEHYIWESPVTDDGWQLLRMYVVRKPGKAKGEDA